MNKRTNKSAVQLYEGTPKQFQGLKNICAEWEQEGFWDVEHINKALATHGTTILFAAADEDETNWVGACFYRHIRESADLLYLYVQSKYRRKGLADHLMGAMVRRLRKAGCAQLMLEVRPQNRAAIALYEVFGMKQTAVREKYYQNGEDALIFKLVLK